MQTMTAKGFAEATIGRARTINERALKEKRDLTAAEQAQFDMLLGAYQEGTGKVVPHDKADFEKFCSSRADDGLAAQLTAEAIGGPGGRGVNLFDERGRCYRGLTNKESFAAAIGGQERYGVTAAHQKMVGEGITAGNLIRALTWAEARTNGEQMALNSSSTSGGGITVPSFLAADLIDKFRAATRLVELGALTIPLDGDAHTFVKITGDPSLAWRREGAAIPNSEPTFGGMTFHPKSLAVIVKVPRELLEDSLNIGQAIERSLTAAFGNELDRAGMFGAGSAEPVGLANEPGINAVTAVGTPASYAKVLDAYKLLLDDNAPDPTGIIMSNREWRTFAGLADTTGQPLMRPQAIQNLPFKATSAVPTNEGGGANESSMLMGYFPDFVFGIRAELQIETLRELFAETHEYGFVAHLRVDTGVFHAESFCKLSGVTSA